jgi:GntR family transcriptional regulator
MFFAIDPSNGLAIYDQIVRQITFAVAGEAIPPGALVPSVRELARTLAVNPNTVTRAYRELQDQGVLHTVRGTGLEVTPEAQKHCQKERIRMVRERLRQVLLEAKHSRLDAGELRTLVEEELARVQESGSRR